MGEREEVVRDVAGGSRLQKDLPDNRSLHRVIRFERGAHRSAKHEAAMAIFTEITGCFRHVWASKCPTEMSHLHENEREAV